MTFKEEKGDVGVVRCTTNRVFDLYDQVKRFSPLLRYGLETVENHIPTAVVNLKDPVIDGLDHRIEQVRETANKKLISPVHDRIISPVQERVIHPVQEKILTLDADQDGKVSLGDVKTSVSTKTTEIVTKTTEKWKDLRGDLTKKATERLERGLGKVCEFSATRGKEILHVDLIQYSREVIDGASATVSRKFQDASATVKPYYEPIYQNVAKSVLKASEAMTQLHEAMATMSTEKLEQAKAARANLRQKLRNAIQAARELSASGVDFVHTKYGGAKGVVSDGYGKAKDVATHLPGQVISHLPEPAQKSVNFILSSPQLFHRIKHKADLDTSKRTLDNINSLMTAVKDVFLEGAHADLSGDEAEEEAEKNED
jgi:hypothetical protein